MDTGEVYALLVGINHYDSPGVRPLKYAVADVLAFRSRAARQGRRRGAPSSFTNWPCSAWPP
jgi:hypothetical protein